MGQPKKKPVTLTAGPSTRRKTALEWGDLKLPYAGGSAAIGVGWEAERYFFVHDMNGNILLREAPKPPANWEGYHAGKHGLWDDIKIPRASKVEMVKMGDFFYGEKYRWVRPEYLKDPNTLKTFTEDEFQKLLEKGFEKAPKESEDIGYLFDAKKFTQDVKDLFEQYKTDPQSTVWTGRLRLRNWQTGEFTELADLQTNVDFLYKGVKFRVSVEAGTKQGLNFMQIFDNVDPSKVMKYRFITLKWQGQVKNVEVHKVEGDTITIEMTSTFRGIFLRGALSGAITGGLISGFFGAISGFRQGGIAGALKGFAYGMFWGGLTGAGIGGAVAVASRIWPIVGRIAMVAGVVTIVATIMLTPSDIGLEPQDWARHEKDADGNVWWYRHIEKRGSIWNPDYFTHGVRVVCTDGSVLEFGENEYGVDATFEDTPIKVWARTKRLKWQMVQTPEGTTMWWWMDLDKQEEFACIFRDLESMRYELSNAHRGNEPIAFTTMQY
jgi:hypothetical protein